MKSCGSRKGSGREMGNYEFNWSGLIIVQYCATFASEDFAQVGSHHTNHGYALGLSLAGSRLYTQPYYHQGYKNYYQIL